MLLVAQNVQGQMMGLLVTNELEEPWKDAVMA